MLVGFCMSGIYVTAESWLNEAATNETRGKVLSAYMIAQTLGIIGAQGLLTLGDAGTAVLFIGALDSRIGFFRADPSVRHPGSGDRGHAPDVSARALLGLAARHRGDLLVGQPLCDPIRHGRSFRDPD